MRGLACIIFLFYAILVGAQKSQLDYLISKGNRAYELSQPTKIKHYADSVFHILETASLSIDDMKDYTVSMLKLYGNYHYEKARLDSAEYYYTKAYNIIAGNPNTDFHGNALLLPREFAQLYYRQGRYKEAETIMSPVYEDMEYNDRYDSIEKLRLKMSYAICLARLNRFDESLSIATEALTDFNDTANLYYAMSQRMYAKIQLLANAGNNGALKAYKSYFATQKKFVRENFARMNSQQREEYWQSLRPFIADCYLLEDSDPAFLYNITLFSKGILLQLTRVSGTGTAQEAALKTLDYVWLDIQKKLGKTDAAIEFIQYGDGQNDKMAALLLRADGKPQFVPLTSPHEIMMIAGEEINSTIRNDKDRFYSDSTFCRKVWTPELIQALHGIKCLYFAPDGYLHRVAIEYMPPVENISVCRLTSTRRLMEGKTESPTASAMLAFGGINYDLDKEQGPVAFNDSDAYAFYIGKHFPNLTTSTNETKEIIAERNNPNDTLITGAEASEYQFRMLSPKFQSILISTHGDFCVKSPVATDLKPVLGDDTMSKSIIAFSGVNSYLANNSFDSKIRCDGLVSARELSSFDLSRCLLFTASACQTALGEISQDGIFGLQRGLKNAGVDAMLLSLWNVNSEACATLMKIFYHNINSGMPLREAFNLARKKLLSENPIETIEYVFDPATMCNKPILSFSQSFNTPQYANAFILIDAID